MGNAIAGADPTMVLRPAFDLFVVDEIRIVDRRSLDLQIARSGSRPKSPPP